MAILRGEAARKYLEQNPQNVKRIISGGEGLDTSMIGKERGLGGLAGILMQPFARLSEGTNQGLYKLMNLLTGDNIAPRALNEKVLGTDVTRSIQKDPLIQGLGKGAAGIGAYAIPGGSGFVQGAVRGAGAGALGGFGASQEGQELQGVGTGAAVGGALGGLLGMIKSPPKLNSEKLNKIGKDMQKQVMTTRPTATRGGINTVAEADSLGGEITDILDKYGSPEWRAIKNPKITDNLLELDRIKNSVADTTAAFREGSNKVVNMTQVQRDIANLPIIKENPSLLRKGTVKQAFEALSNTGEGLVIPGEGISRNTTVDNLYRVLKDNIDSNINYNAPGGAKTGVEQEALKQMQRALRDTIDTALGGQYTAANSVYGTIQKFQSAGGDARLWQQAKGMTPVLNRTGIQEVFPGIGDTVGGLKYATGGLLQRIGSKQATVRSQGVKELIEILSKSAPLAASGIVGRAQEPIETPHIQGSSVVGAIGQTRPVSIIEALAISSSMLPGQSFASQLSLAKEIVKESKPPKLTDNQAKAASAIQSLETMEAVMESDKNALLKTYLPFQGFDEKAQVLEAASSNVEDTITRMRTGAVINLAEEKRYRKMVPRITDTDATKVFKIQQLKAIFNQLLQRAGNQTEMGVLSDLLGGIQ